MRNSKLLIVVDYVYTVSLAITVVNHSLGLSINDLWISFTGQSDIGQHFWWYCELCNDSQGNYQRL